MTLIQDIRYALRVLRNHLGFTVIAILTLGLGIGANSAIFSVIHSVLLRPLPFPQPERIVQVWESRADRGWIRASMNPANFWDFRDQNQTLEDLTARFGRSLVLTGLGFPERIDGALISAGFFRVLGVQPVLGRTFAPGEDEPGGDTKVALLANDFWRRRFGADPGIVGTTLTLDGETHTVVGVLPPGDPWLSSADVFVPFVRQPDADRVGFYLAVIGRLKPGVTLEMARSDLETIARRLEEQYPEANAGIGVDLAPASEWVADDNLRRALWILFGAVGFLLLIACVNLANMLLAKATGRTRETAVRAALGADRRRITRQVLTESLVLGLFGGGVGLLFAFWGIDAVKAFDPGGIPRLDQIGLNPWVLAFTVTIGVATGVLSGLMPAIQLPATDLAMALREGHRGLAGAGSQKRVRNALVAAEVALSLLLLVGAGLLIRSFGEVMGVERGFQSDGRLVVAVAMPGSYDEQRRGEVRDRFIERIGGIPAVRSVSAVSSRPLTGGSVGMGIAAAGQPEDPDAGVPWAEWRLVTADHFRTMGIPLLKGRTFDERDQIGEPWRAIISERLAEMLWPGEDPIGRTAILWKGQGDLEAEVIGVVGNMREIRLDSDPTLVVYLPYYGAGWSPMHFVINTTSAPAALVPTLRSMLAEIDPNLPISDVRSMDEIVSNSVATRRFNMAMLTIFAGIALLLALAGIYGVQAYSVTRRTSEIGIRVAMGARPTQIIAEIVGQGMRPAVLGIVVGVAGAFVLSRLMSSLLYGIAPSDFLTYASVALMLAAAALLSCYVPARRALRIDPVNALRDE
ncbi:MAG: ABC transporter permease [Gemmatimonadales bacterium]|jgi:putative ABC transport system permease protein